MQNTEGLILDDENINDYSDDIVKYVNIELGYKIIDTEIDEIIIDGNNIILYGNIIKKSDIDIDDDIYNDECISDDVYDNVKVDKDKIEEYLSDLYF